MRLLQVFSDYLIELPHQEFCQIQSYLKLLLKLTELNKIDSGSRICYEQSVRLNVALSIEFKLELKN